MKYTSPVEYLQYTMLSEMNEKQVINALIPVHMVALPSMQYPKVDSIAIDVFVIHPPLGDPVLIVCTHTSHLALPIKELSSRKSEPP